MTRIKGSKLDSNSEPRIKSESLFSRNTSFGIKRTETDYWSWKKIIIIIVSVLYYIKV